MDLIYIAENTLPGEICDKIIKNFEEDDQKKLGTINGKINLNIKKTMELFIDKNNKKWKETDDFLFNEIDKHLKNYFKKLLGVYVGFENLENSGFYINKFKKNDGRELYHHDFEINPERTKYRVLTFMWYLNDIKEGGESEFFGTYKIKPQRGKLVIFPASWTHPYENCIPISEDKYVICGWIYSNF